MYLVFKASLHNQIAVTRELHFPINFYLKLTNNKDLYCNGVFRFLMWSVRFPYNSTRVVSLVSSFHAKNMKCATVRVNHYSFCG